MDDNSDKDAKQQSQQTWLAWSKDSTITMYQRKLAVASKRTFAAKSRNYWGNPAISLPGIYLEAYKLVFTQEPE